MSGSSGLIFNIMNSSSILSTAEVAKSVNCTSPPAHDPDSQETLTCLKNTPIETLNRFAISYPEDGKPRIGGPFFYPSYDGDLIPERSSVSLQKGDFVKGTLSSPPSTRPPRKKHKKEKLKKKG